MAWRKDFRLRRWAGLAGALVLPSEPRDQSVVTFLLSLSIPIVEWAVTHVMTAPATQAVQAGTI